MVLYVDTSALLKRYVAEAESENVVAKMDAATATSTALITRTEVAAALSRARRENRMEANERGYGVRVLRQGTAPSSESRRTGDLAGVIGQTKVEAHDGAPPADEPAVAMVARVIDTRSN